MKRIFSLRVVITLLVALVIAALIAVGMAVSERTPLGQRITETMLQPVRSGVAALTRQVERIYNYMYDYDRLEAENDILRERIAQLEQENQAAAELLAENERLREFLNLQEEHDEFSYLTAYITGWDSSNYRSSFTIGKGSASGITEGIAALNEYGQMVGVVTDVGLNWATITTVLDSNLRISAQISGSGYTGVAQGTLQTGADGDIRLNYVSVNAVMKNGDLVVTSGSDTYPKGLALGYVSAFGLSEGGTDRFATVTAGADFSSLEQVFLILDYTAY